MGTRCLTVFNDENDKEIAVLYRQGDGYLEGHGGLLKKILKGRKLVNGFNSNDVEEGNYNSMGDLAVRVIMCCKQGDKVDSGDVPGSFYLYKADTRDVGEEFIYTVYGKERDIWLTVKYKHDSSPLYDGPVDDFNPHMKRPEN